MGRSPHLAALALAALVGSAGCARGPGPAQPRSTSPGAGGSPLGRSYQPALFARGQDPSGGPECLGVVNPERGFFAFRDLLAPTDLEGLRASGASLVYGRALLAEYRDRPLPRALLDRLRAGFAAIRQAGLKVLPRFYYAADADAPDASIARALEHIAALAPLLRENADVIAALHAGFLGAWGEWHPDDRASAADRRRILEALLAALPDTRMVLVRRPHWKQLAFGGPLTAAQAFGPSPLARLGQLNDCFLASPDDFGTFRTPAEQRYALMEAQFVAVGGETCAANPPRSECPSALAELERHHWSFLNRDYHAEVVNGWRAGGCLPTIACRLGYRLVVAGWQLPPAARAGQRLSLTVMLANDGYARAYNPRPVLLALAPAPVGEPGVQNQPPILVATGGDARHWAPGAAPAATVLEATLPADLAPGEYRIGLALPDPAPSLAGDARYAIQMVGGVAFERETGINWLEALVKITR